MKFCYADPPYPGMAFRYKDHPDYGGEVDHRVLINRLVEEFPDGWALSTSTVALRSILPLCPESVRILAWVKPFAAFKPNVTLAYAWEPVLLNGGRKLPRGVATATDWVAASITLKRGLVGVKPDAVCFWLFRCLGAIQGDELVDLFPGSGAVGRAWETYQRQTTLPGITSQFAKTKLL